MVAKRLKEGGTSWYISPDEEYYVAIAPGDGSSIKWTRLPLHTWASACDLEWQYQAGADPFGARFVIATQPLHAYLVVPITKDVGSMIYDPGLKWPGRPILTAIDGRGRTVVLVFP